jgi:2-polyprenyl-6-methoxyphenol hydroxylase-like FAD-dependent oxidoreductase
MELEPLMRKSDRREVPVLIVGSGPAGLAAAITLARSGVGSLLVERRTTLSTLPRATVVSTRSMELMRSWGLEDEVRDGEVDVDWLIWRCKTLGTVVDGEAVPAGLPTREQSAAISPTSPACVPQDHLEPVLLGHLRTLDGAAVELGTEVVDVDSRPDGVEAVLRDVRTGKTRTVWARYLIAGDGAHSAVRSALGISMRGPDRLLEAATALFRAPLWEMLGDVRYGLYATNHPEAEGSFLPAGPGDRWLYGTMWEPGTDERSSFTEERLTGMIRLGAGVADLEPRIERTGTFTFAAQLADSFRHESAFLVGDAAHRVTPRGGTGMNTAIQDGHDLGWKLAWVLRGWAEPALLDTYETERRPLVEHNLRRSADPDGSARAVDEELHADLGGRIPHVWMPFAGGRVSTIDLLGPGLTLFTEGRDEAWAAAAEALPGPLPLNIQRLGLVAARALGLRGGALLARPDGAPAAWWPAGSEPLPALRAAVPSAPGGDPERDAVTLAR